MRKRMEVKILMWIILAGILTLSACDMSVAYPETPFDLDEPIETSAIEETSMPTPTATFTLTNTPMATASNPPISTSTRTLVPSWTPTLTPFPTLVEDKALELFDKLMTDNGGCDLPCWWGVIPGKARWGPTEQFLNTFATEILQGGSVEVVEDGETIKKTNYSAYFDLKDSQNRMEVNFSLRNGMIIAVNVLPGEITASYQIHELLNNYGKPDAVTLHTTASDLLGYYPFRLFIYYAGGIFAYYDYEAELSGENLIGCYSDTDPELILWSGDLDWTHTYLEQITLGVFYDFDYPKKLSEATEMSIDEFYDAVLGAENSVCIETPADLWP